jgi:outer membrane lipoprotein SlyB
MELDKAKIVFACYAMSLMFGLQIAAWALGQDGLIFAATSAISGAIAGSILGFAIKDKLDK